MSKDSVKVQIDIDITNKTTSKSISPLNVGGNMKAVVDLIPDVTVKTIGNILAVNGLKTTLQYDINTVNKDGGSEVKLPTTTEVGKEVLFLASNYAGTVSVYVNDAEDVKLSGGINGVSGNQGNLQINANEAYRFISLGNDYWYFEKIIDIPNNYYQLVSERTTDGTLSTNSNFKYPTEQALKTYVDSKDSRPYKVYTALLSQSGTDAPTASVLENTLGVTISWTYIGVGNYRGTATGNVFTTNKSTSFISLTFAGNVNSLPFSTSEIVVNTYSTTFISTNNLLYKTPIEIRVYN